MDVRAFGSWTSAPKCLFFQDFEGLTAVSRFFKHIGETFLRKFKHPSSHRVFVPVLSMGLLVFGCNGPCLPELSTLFRNERSVSQKRR